MVKITKSLKKELYSTIRINIKKYISLILIIFLGVSFYVGMKSNSPTLQDSMIKHLDKLNYMDLQITSIIGINNEEMEKLKKEIPEIKTIEGGYLKEATIEVLNKDTENFEKHNFAIHSYDPNKLLNKLEITDGVMAKENDECVLDASARKIGYDIGDTIIINTEYLTNKEYKVVGLARSPLYLSSDKGSSIMLGGALDYFIYINESNFIDEDGLYTNVYIDVDTKSKTFSDEYNEEIYRIQEKISELGFNISKARREDFITDNTALIASAETKFNDEKEKYTNELDKGKELLTNAEQQIKEAESKIMSDIEVDIYLNSTANTLLISKQQLDTMNATINATKELISSSKNINPSDEYQEKINSAEEIIKNSEKIIKEKIEELKKVEEKCDLLTDEQLKQSCLVEKQAIEQTISDNQESIDTAKGEIKVLEELIKSITENTIPNTQKDINGLKSYLKQLEEKYNKANNEYLKAEKEYNYAKANLKKEMAEARKTLAAKKEELAKSKEEYEAKKAEVEIGLENASQEILNNKKLLNGVKNLKWNVTNRNDNYGYNSYISDIKRIEGLGKVFPIFFYLIAALVTVSSITRMVKEERKKIGTLKSLGYKDKEVTYKYIYYISSAVFIGSILGTIVGTLVFPRIFSVVYSLVYFMPDVITRFYIRYILFAILLAIISCVGIGYLSIKETLKESPYNLMKVQTTKFKGKIWLERFKNFWRKLSFSRKVTYRNILNNPKKSLMTILGIMGCTSLIVGSIGLRDSISKVIFTQYGKIFEMNSEFFFKSTLSEQEMHEQQEKVNSLKDVNYSILANLESVKIKDLNNPGNISVYTAVPDNEKLIERILHLRDPKTKEKLELNDEGVIITNKLSQILKVKVGDYITFTDNTNLIHRVKVTGITEHYVFHYIYMTKNLYQKTYGVESKNNSLFVKYNEDADDETINESINALGSFNGLVSLATAERSYNNIIEKFTMVIIVTIISSGLLAFVVLYNLAKINISEKTRDIATLKVLGYKGKEVYKYINNEMTILSVIGIILGLITGYFLTNILINMIELDTMMYVHELSIKSYIAALILTVTFIFLINLVVKRDLNKIEMVDSLKMME